jgi:hypothetical protein
VVGGLCSLFAYLYLRYTHPAYNAAGQYTAPVVLFAFLIGAQCLLTLGAAIEAGVSTIFVGLAEDPQVLAERSPELFGVRTCVLRTWGTAADGGCRWSRSTTRTSRRPCGGENLWLGSNQATVSQTHGQLLLECTHSYNTHVIIVTAQKERLERSWSRRMAKG